MITNNGGPAFPVSCEDWKGVSEGMTLRDYFAAKAMQGLVASGEYQNGTAEWISEAAYAIADAMLSAREGDKA